MRSSRIHALLLSAPLLGSVACNEPVQVGAPAPTAARPGGPGPAAPAAPGAPAPAAAPVDAGVDAGPHVYRDEDFVEQDVINRDPFRDFVLSIQAQTMLASPRQVKMRNVSLDQMRLIAIISGIPVPYAMIQDPEGIGHVVVRGDYIGRDEVVNAGGADGMPIALNWRIDRIREGELILTREDPLHPDQPPLMRSMAIRDVGMEEADPGAVQQGQLGNTGATPVAGAAAPTPGGAFAAPTPTPAPTPPRNRGGYGAEPAPAPSPAPAPAPSTSNGDGTSSGSTSPFGGVFRR